MHTGFARRLRRVLLGLAHVALASKLLIPAGYMPAAIGAGGPIALCPGEFPIELLSGPAGHADHGEHTEHDDASIREHCSLGALAATPALAGASAVGIAPAAPGPIAQTEIGIAPRVHSALFRARAPPRPIR